MYCTTKLYTILLRGLYNHCHLRKSVVLSMKLCGFIYVVLIQVDYQTLHCLSRRRNLLAENAPFVRILTFLTVKNQESFLLMTTPDRKTLQNYKRKDEECEKHQRIWLNALFMRQVARCCFVQNVASHGLPFNN